MWRRDSVLPTSRVSMHWISCPTVCRLTEDDNDGQMLLDKRHGTNLHIQYEHLCQSVQIDIAAYSVDGIARRALTCRFVICLHGDCFDSTGQRSLCACAGVDDKKVQTDIEGEDGRKRELHFSACLLLRLNFTLLSECAPKTMMARQKADFTTAFVHHPCLPYP